MSIYRILDKLEGYVREGTWLPFGYKILSEERLFEYLEKMRATLPEEVGRAKMIANNRERVIREAQDRAQAIVQEASSAHGQMIEQSEIVRQARVTAEVIMREAEERARKVKLGADNYAAQVLAELDTRLKSALGSIHAGQDALAVAKAAAETAADLGPAASELPPPANPGPRMRKFVYDASEDITLASVGVAK